MKKENIDDIKQRWKDYLESYGTTGLKYASLLSATHVVNLLIDDSFKEGKSQQKKEFIEMIEKICNQRLNYYYDKEDWEETYLPFIREINLIREELRKQLEKT